MGLALDSVVLFALRTLNFQDTGIKLVPIEHVFALAGKPRFHGQSWMFAQCGRSSTCSLSLPSVCVLAVNWKHFLKQFKMSLWKTSTLVRLAGTHTSSFSAILTVISAAGVDIFNPFSGNFILSNFRF